MRYIVYGAGGIGSVIGGFLFKAGIEVILKGRPAHVSAIKENGLSLISSKDRYKIKIPATDSVEDIKPFRSDDVILLTAKSQHTHICLSELKIAGAPVDLPICCMQNSVWNESQAIRTFDKIYGVMIIVPGYYMVPGEVIHWFSGELGYINIGRYPSGIDDLCTRIASDLNKTGFVAETHKRVMRSKGGKCIGNLANAYSVIKGTKKQEEYYLKIIKKEAETVWTAAGIEFESTDDLYKRFRESTNIKLWDAPELKGKKYGGSGWQTLARRAGSSETSKLNGDVVDLGKELGISTPANQALCDISISAALKGKEPESTLYVELEKLYKNYLI